jgi:hypothetical protein
MRLIPAGYRHGNVDFASQNTLPRPMPNSPKHPLQKQKSTHLSPSSKMNVVVINP